MKRTHFAVPVPRWQLLVPCAVLLALNIPTPAQADAVQPVYGFYDLKTHAFTPAAPQPAATAVTPIVRTGKLTFQVSVKLGASSANSQAMAYATAYLYDTNYQNSIGNSAAMKRSGANATVTMTIPYVFTAQSATEKITVRVQIVTQAPPFPYTVLIQEVTLPADGADTVVALAGAI